MLEIKIFKDGELLKQAQGDFLVGSLFSGTGIPGVAKTENMIVGGGSVNKSATLIGMADLCATVMAVVYDNCDERKMAARLFIDSFIEATSEKLGI